MEGEEEGEGWWTVGDEVGSIRASGSGYPISADDEGRLIVGPEVYTKRKRAQTDEDDESWGAGEVSPTLNGFDVGDARAVTLVTGGEASYHQRDRVYSDLAPALDAHSHSPGDPPMVAGDFATGDDPLLPPGLDAHRYRCCGNAVVVPVAEWIGLRLAAALAVYHHDGS